MTLRYNERKVLNVKYLFRLINVFIFYAIEMTKKKLILYILKLISAICKVNNNKIATL